MDEQRLRRTVGLLSQAIALAVLEQCRQIGRARFCSLALRRLHARVAYDNVASHRVPEKCGFRVIATERSFAQARSAEIEEFVLRLEEPGSAT